MKGFKLPLQIKKNVPPSKFNKSLFMILLDQMSFNSIYKIKELNIFQIIDRHMANGVYATTDHCSSWFSWTKGLLIPFIKSKNETFSK